MNKDWETVVLRKKTETVKKQPQYQHPKITSDNDVKPIERVSHELSLAIQKARTDKKMTRKELAMKVNVTEAIIADYENGKATPNGLLINKIGTALGISLSKKQFKN